MSAPSNRHQDGFRVGEVCSTNPKKATARVKFQELDGFKSWDLQVVQMNAFRNKDYWMPDEGEQVLCVFLGNGLERGFVLGSVYSEKDFPPTDSQDKRHTRYEDGTWFEYDRKEHKLSVHVEGDITIEATGQINIKAGGKVFIDGQEIRLND